jgi:hypothetical protein
LEQYWNNTKILGTIPLRDGKVRLTNEKTLGKLRSSLVRNAQAFALFALATALIQR